MTSLRINGRILIAGAAFALAAQVAHAADGPVALAAKSFSTELCAPKDPAAVADIPKAVSGFTGYAQAPGDWLAQPDASPLKGKRVALSVMGLGQPFFLAIKKQWEMLAQKYGFELKVYDGRFDAGTVQKLVDDIIADAPDAVAFAPLDSGAAVPQVQRMLDAGLKVVTYNVQPAEVVAPRVFADDYAGSQLVGCNAARYFVEKFGDKPAIIGIVDLPSLPQVQDRKNGFLYGFKSVIPTAVVAQSVDGGGVIDKANPAAADLLQGNPNLDVIFGINNDSSLGALAAMKAANLYAPDWGVVASVDGSEPIMAELGSDESPLKAESGYPPYDFSVATFNLLGATLDGNTTKDAQVVVGYPPINPTAEGIKAWLSRQYPR